MNKRRNEMKKPLPPPNYPSEGPVEWAKEKEI
jgi:hypothetical protein